MTNQPITPILAKSPSLTPDRQKQAQQERNEDSAPQQLRAVPAHDDGAGRPNATPIGSIRVPLTRGLFALVDAADAERVLAFSWHTKRQAKRPTYIYAQRSYRADGRKLTESQKCFGDHASLNFPDAWFGPQPPPAAAGDFAFLRGVAP